MRIIAGRVKGQTIQTPRGQKTRPTSDKVREALFSILESALGDLEQCRVIDLFAGSGALGLEALSRGAKHAHFVEHDRSCQRIIRQNIEHLGFKERSDVLAMPVRSALGILKRDSQSFDLVFVDPPYALPTKGLLIDLAEMLSFEPGALLTLEHERKEEPPDEVGDLQLYKRKRYGGTTLSIYRKE